MKQERGEETVRPQRKGVSTSLQRKITRLSVAWGLAGEDGAERAPLFRGEKDLSWHRRGGRKKLPSTAAEKSYVLGTVTGRDVSVVVGG